MKLRPFWRYCGAKWRLAPRYPAPRYDTIVEPFAGAAGYSLRYPDRRVVLVDIYPVIAEIWRWLIGTSSSEILSLPIVDAIDDLPWSTPEGARLLIGMCMSNVVSRPRETASRWLVDRRGHGWCEGWSMKMRDRIARQVDHIRHWLVIEGSYLQAPSVGATWFIDPPYRGRPGSRYVHGSAGIDYSELAHWCQSLDGQVIVCESADARWLPFRQFATTNGVGGATSAEGVWLSDEEETFGWSPS